MIDTNKLKSIFESDYNRAKWLDTLREIFYIHNFLAIPEPVDLPSNDYDAIAHELGYFETSEGLLIGLYEVSISPQKRLDRIKSGLRNLMRHVYQRDVDAALIVFTQGASWRFSYASELTVVNKETGKREKRQTDPKRYTYLLGLGQHCRTAAERFASLKTSADLLDTKISIKEIEKAFSVDILTKDFYRELSNWYFWALNHVTFPDDDQLSTEPRNPINLIRLITRLIFVWFLKQKRLVPDELFDKEKIWPHLIFAFEPGSTYYKAILQNLFFATLNQEMPKRDFRKNGQHYNITNLFRYRRFFRNPDETIELFRNIPFLNGGLFECLDKPHPTEKTPQGNEKIVRIDGFSDRPDNPLRVPDYLFFGGAKAVDLSMVYDDSRQRSVNIRGIIEILNSYNFTVEENTPLEIQVALDPELLGKVFENLLASYNPETKTTARKQTGSFYTPREIVNYMVDESLIAYLKQKLSGEAGHNEEKTEARLRDLVSYSGNGNPFDDAETQTLVKAIDGIKVLDPACGSGAFPMGVLQQLVHILQKLDPDNHLWKQLQMQRANTEIQEAIASGDTGSFAERLKEIADAFENNAEDYGRKLYLIENCIYGVDIQPIAVQIAKLRFFISLLVDQTINPENENLGIRALPNLETKFVAANTLIGLDAKMTFKPDKVYKLEKELEKVRHRHFNARTPETKRKYRLRDRELRNEIARELIDANFPETDANKIAAWDPYDQNVSSPFFDRYWMFGLSDGFDVVIGNPPYGADYSPSDKKYFLENFLSAKTIKNKQKGSLDTFTLFIEQGFHSLQLNGNLSFIVPISITSSDSMTGIHTLLEKNCEEIRISSFAVRPQPVFQNAVVNTSILFFSRSDKKCTRILLTKMYRKNNEIDLDQLVRELEFIDVKKYRLIGRYPKVSHEIEKSILDKIYSQKTSIRDLIKSTGKPIYYRTTGGRYYKVITNYPTGSTKETSILFDKEIVNCIGAVLSSNLYFWFYQIYSNNLDLKFYEIASFKIPLENLTKEKIKKIETIYSSYLNDIERNANVRQTTRYANIESFKEYKIGKSKFLIDQIDDLVGPLYGLTNEEIDFVKNYEINFRLTDEDRE